MDEIEQQVALEQALGAYWRATELTGEYDPAEDTRVEEPHQRLAALAGEPVAKAIGTLFRQIRGELLEI